MRDLVDRSKVSGLLKEAAWQSQLVGIDNTADGTAVQWTLAVEHESLRATSLCERLEALLREATGQTLVLRMIAADAGDSPARREARLKERMQAEAEEAVRNDPLIGDLMAQFPGARLVPGSVRPA